MLAWSVSQRAAGRRPPPAEEPVLPAGRRDRALGPAQQRCRRRRRRRGGQGLGAGPRARPRARASGWRPPSSPSSSGRYAGTARSARPTWCCRAATGRPGTVTARVAPLSSRLVLALVEDRTRERRVESVRRDFVANVSHELKTPGRRDPAPRRGRRRRLRRPRGGRALRPPDAHRERPAACRWCSRSSSSRGSRATSRSRRRPWSTSTRSSSGRSTSRSWTPRASDIKVVSGGTPGLRIFGNEEQVSAAVDQPARQRRHLLRATTRRC